MSELKELFEKGEYQKILEETEKPENGEEALYKVSALLSENRLKDAHKAFFMHRDLIYDHNPLLCLKTDLELRFLVSEFDEAYEDESYFANKPYVNQRMEEELRDYRKKVREEERRAYKSSLVKEGKIEEALGENPSAQEVFSVLTSLEGEEKKRNMAWIGSVAASYPNDSIKTYALLLLVEQKDETPIKFKKGEKEWDVIPSSLVVPFAGEEHLSFIKKLENSGKDVSKRDLAFRLYSEYLLLLYPDTPTLDDDLLEALNLLASYYLGQSELTGSGSEKAQEILDLLKKEG